MSVAKASGSPGAPVALTRRKQLLVEGKDQKNFFEKMLRDIGRHDSFEVHDFGGVTELKKYLAGFVQRSGFDGVESLGVARDAEETAEGAFESVRHGLENAGLPMPEVVGESASGAGSPTVAVFILGGDGGMLETLLNRTVAEEPEQECVDLFLKCVEGVSGAPIGRPQKARAHAWIATRDHPEVSVGVAAQKGYWRLEHPALEELRSFLERL